MSRCIIMGRCELDGQMCITLCRIPSYKNHSAAVIPWPILRFSEIQCDLYVCLSSMIEGGKQKSRMKEFICSCNLMPMPQNQTKFLSQWSAYP